MPQYPPERRRRLLFLGQVGAGGFSAVVIDVLWFHVARSNPAATIALSVGVAAVLWWVLSRWEQAKFAPVEVSGTDYARELREVRDSRRVIVAAFEIERRRIERDLHDGAQQYLVAATMKLGEAGLILEQDTTGPDLSTFVAGLLEGAHQDAEEALRTLRATVSGIHPQVLTDLGLHAAVADMAQRSGLDVTVRCPHRLPDMPQEVAAVAWFFCSETLTNIAKHTADATATLLLAADQDLHVSITDNGPGAAHLRKGGGLAGMRERLAAFGGVMNLSSPPGGPTIVSARIPLLLAPSCAKQQVR